MRFLILHDAVGDDARPDERDALIQAAQVSAALERLGHSTAVRGVDLDLRTIERAVADERPDRVFNLVESLAGHGRLIHVVPAVLDALGVTYTGNPTAAVYITSGKVLAKQLMRLHDIPTPASYTLRDLQTAQRDFRPDRYIVKSVWEHASLGIDEGSVLHAESPETLRQALDARLPALGGDGFAEQFVDGREFNIAMLASGSDAAPEVLPHAELTFDTFPAGKVRVVDYRAKWDEHSFEYNNTVRRYEFPESDRPLLQRLSAVSRKCWDVFGLRGYVRVDFRIDAAGTPWVLEVNTNPCLADDAGYYAALLQAGISFDTAIARIVADSITRNTTMPSNRSTPS